MAEKKKGIRLKGVGKLLLKVAKSKAVPPVISKHAKVIEEANRLKEASKDKPKFKKAIDVAKSPILIDFALEALDINKDGKISIADLEELKKKKGKDLAKAIIGILLLLGFFAALIFIEF